MKSKVKVEDIFKAPDDRVVVVSVSEMKRNFEKEYNHRAEEMFEQIKRDVVAQLMAVVLTVLHNELGFGTKRMRRFKRAVEALFVAMSRDGIMGRKFNTQNCIDLMRDEYGIDVEAKNIEKE